MFEQGTVFIFINFKQAAGFGHVGWGFQVSEQSYFFGSSDHLWKHRWFDLPSWWRYMHVPPEGDIDWWAKQGSKDEMLGEMKCGKHIRYHAFKCLSASRANPQRALDFAHELKVRGWDLCRHNCVHQAYLVASSYGLDSQLPDPFLEFSNLIPKTWFARIQASSSEL